MIAIRDSWLQYTCTIFFDALFMEWLLSDCCQIGVGKLGEEATEESCKLIVQSGEDFPPRL